MFHGFTGGLSTLLHRVGAVRRGGRIADRIANPTIVLTDATHRHATIVLTLAGHIANIVLTFASHATIVLLSEAEL